MAAAQNESLAPANANASQGIWEHFTKTLHKVNTAHYGAICNGCAAKGLKGDKGAHHCLNNKVNMGREFEKILLEFTVQCAKVYDWVEKPSAKALFAIMRNKAKLSAQNTLAGSILEREALTIETDMKKELKNNESISLLEAVTLILDSWTNVKREQPLGFTVATANRNVSTCQKARRIAAAQMPGLIVMDCVVHQIHLMVGDYLKSNNRYPEVMKQALQVLVWFTSHTVPSAWLQEKLVAVESKTMALIIPAITWWGSHVESISRLLQVCMHLMPLKVAGRLLEQDATRLDTVVRTLARLSKNFQNILEVDASHALESILEKRWLKMLQPIMVLAYVLHPMLQLNHINRMEPIGQPHNLCQLASNLYTEYFGGTIEYRDAVIRQNAKPQLAAVALRLFGMFVHAGSIERLWSALGLIQTKSRNRLDSAKAVKIAQIQAAIRSRVAIQEATGHTKPRGTNAPQRQFQR
ncbi:hypothetical protein AXG93_1660s1290 [Marchantia polymorpha subsp. ruderalis]|uniref:DUF659 domain-containing protein n=1 Tax=Marchantia polymorpha subsp. ruderalis TaxID=1480154 RepID=A0A176VR94_MARPO|nr:hypothetical protein AXG93_1660s1290 [Marchantia polymorpha subsp. ruderalis]